MSFVFNLKWLTNPYSQYLTYNSPLDYHNVLV